MSLYASWWALATSSLDAVLVCHWVHPCGTMCRQLSLLCHRAMFVDLIAKWRRLELGWWRGSSGDRSTNRVLNLRTSDGAILEWARAGELASR